MVEYLTNLGSGPPIRLEIVDWKGVQVRAIVVPEDLLEQFVKALDQAGGAGLGSIDLYGDTVLSHDRCLRALDTCLRALKLLQSANAIRCGEIIVQVVSDVARNPKLNLFVKGN